MTNVYKSVTLNTQQKGVITAVYLIDEFTDYNGVPVFVVADVKTVYNPDIDKEQYKEHRCYLARSVAYQTYYAYERIELGANVNFERFFDSLCELKGANLYVSAKA